MKRIVLVYTVCLSLILMGCVTPKPINHDDAYIILDLKRSFVQDHAAAPDTFLDRSSGGDCGGNWLDGFNGCDDLGELVVAVVIIAVVVVAAAGIERVVKGLQGTDVYAIPAMDPDYIQRVTWGKNRVYIPRRLYKKRFKLNIRIKGAYKGNTSIWISPYEQFLQDVIEVRESPKPHKKGKKAIKQTEQQGKPDFDIFEELY